MQNVKEMAVGIEPNVAPCHRLFSLIPIETVKEILDFPLGSIAMRKAVEKCIDDHDLVISKCYTHHELSMIQLCAQKGVPVESEQFFNQTSDLKRPIFLPEIDIWDAALLDFYMCVIDWSSTSWMSMVSEVQDEKDINKLNFLADAYQSVEATLEKREMAVCFGFATVYLILKSLQLWQKEYLSENDASSIIGTIYFIKHLFRSPTLEQQDMTETEQQADNKVLLWQQLVVKYAGLLNVLNEDVAAILIEYLTVNVLHKHLLLERLFGSVAARKQKSLEISSAFDLWTLPKVFGNTKYEWPPPLSEAIPLNIVETYTDLFDERIKRWLPCLLPDDDVLPAAEVLQDGGEGEQITDQIDSATTLVGEEETRQDDNQTDLHLLLLKLLKPDELLLLSSLSNEEVNETVEEVVQAHSMEQDEGIAETGSVSREELSTSQSKLANQLVEAAQETVKSEEETLTEKCV